MFYNKYMNDDICEMINVYNTYEFDWMGDRINSPSDLTRHHIIKKQYNGIDDSRRRFTKYISEDHI